MLKSPKKTKYKSPHLHLGEKGLKGVKLRQKGIIVKSKKAHLLSPRQREVTRRTLAKPIREEYGNLNIRFFPDHSMTKKPLQTRMGKGKGQHHKWVAPINKGRPLVQITGRYKLRIIRRLYRKLTHKLPIDLKIMYPKRRRILIKDNKQVIKK